MIPNGKLDHGESRGLGKKVRLMEENLTFPLDISTFFLIGSV